jgi:hypothetical protein
MLKNLTLLKTLTFLLKTIYYYHIKYNYKIMIANIENFRKEKNKTQDEVAKYL